MSLKDFFTRRSSPEWNERIAILPPGAMTEGSFSRKVSSTSNSLFTSIRRAWNTLAQDFFTASFRSFSGRKDSAPATASDRLVVVSILFPFLRVNGASLATIISQFISFVWIIIFFYTKNSIFKLRIKDMRLQWKRILCIMSLGLSPFIMAITECAIQIVFNINLNISTGGNKDYTAALTIMMSALQLISLPLNGLGYGMQPFVSYNFGKGI